MMARECFLRQTFAATPYARRSVVGGLLHVQISRALPLSLVLWLPRAGSHRCRALTHAARSFSPHALRTTTLLSCCCINIDLSFSFSLSESSCQYQRGSVPCRGDGGGSPCGRPRRCRTSRLRADAPPRRGVSQPPPPPLYPVPCWLPSTSIMNEHRSSPRTCRWFVVFLDRGEGVLFSGV